MYAAPSPRHARFQRDSKPLDNCAGISHLRLPICQIPHTTQARTFFFASCAAMGQCASKSSTEVVAVEPKTTPKEVDDLIQQVDLSPLTSDALQFEPLPDSYYEGVGLIKVGDGVWKCPPMAVQEEPVATSPAELTPEAEETISRWQKVKDSIASVAPSKEGRVASVAMWLYNRILAEAPAAARKEVRCPVCTFNHYASTTICPRCGH